MRSVLIVVHRLGSGGVTNAVLDQSHMFLGAGYDTTIATFDDDPGFAESIDELRASGRLPRGVDVLNIYADSSRAASGAFPLALRPRRVRAAAGRFLARRLPRWAQHELVERGRDKHGPYARRFTRTGQYSAFDRLDEKGETLHTNHFENRVLIRRDELSQGAVSRRTWFAVDGSPNRIEFVSPTDVVYAQRWLSPEDGHGVGVYVADPHARTMTRYSGLPDWHVAWLQGVVDRCPTPPLVIAQTASAIPKVLSLRRSSALRLAMMHNSHVATPFTIDSPTRPDYDATFTQLDELDAFAILSERQRGDMVDRLGHEEAFTVTPNAIRVPDDVPVDVEVDPNLVTVVSRLAPQKALHEAIHAFSAVLRSMPEARLEIYGDGPDRKRLKALAHELGLQDKVLLMGRTDDPHSVMARSVCTISTSDWEALPLSIAESLVVGTPVVAYDCLYGPSTLIRQGESGIVVPHGDRDALADAIVTLLRSPDLAQDMGRAGRADISSRLSFDAVLREWEATFAHAERRSGLGAATR